MNTPARTLANMLAHADAAANPGMRTMRLTLAAQACAKALGLPERDTPEAPAKAARPAKARVSADKPEPAGPLHAWRVCLLVRGEQAGTQAYVWVSVDAPSPRGAGRAARKAHGTGAVVACVREDAPSAVIAALG